MSDAVTLDRVSRIVGYKLTTGNFNKTTPNLPQRIAILAEANAANQSGLDTDPYQLVTAADAGNKYGWGSPIHMIARILLPKSGGGVAGIPVYVYPQAVAGSATTKQIEITPSGVATGNGTHTVVIAGRPGIDGEYYTFNIVEGDTAADITAKISDAVNNVLSSPLTGSDTDYVAALETKWAGLTANDISVTVDKGITDLGIDYTIDVVQSGSGTPSIAAALNKFQNNWNTLVVNSYGAVSSIMSALENFNGIPDPTTPTGRFVGIVMKPFVALTGSVLDDPTSITDGRSSQVTIAICPAPLSAGHPMEAAANMCVLQAVTAQNNPHLDVAGNSYPDMPTPDAIGSMSDYNYRDVFVKKGCSTVNLQSEKYLVEDFVTTYHPLGENPPQFRYVRNLILDFNVRFGYYLLEQINVVDHVIAADADVVTATKVIKPKQWIQIVSDYAVDLAKRALITQPEFTQASLEVDLSATNPDRLETFFRYKRTGTVRVASTTAEAGFNFGVL